MVTARVVMLLEINMRASSIEVWEPVTEGMRWHVPGVAVTCGMLTRPAACMCSCV